MKKKTRPPVHKAPKDLMHAINAHPQSLETWKDITPLAKNEWACWVMSAKQEETRARRIRIAVDKLQKGDRRPCCWPGCPHR